MSVLNWFLNLFRPKSELKLCYVREMLIVHPNGMVFSNDGVNWLRIDKCFYCGLRADEGDTWRWEQEGESCQQGHRDCFYKFWKATPVVQDYHQYISITSGPPA